MIAIDFRFPLVKLWDVRAVWLP